MTIHAAPLDGTVDALGKIVAETKAAGSNNGIFAALYRAITVRTRDASTEGGFFDDDARMAELAVAFAERYLDAYGVHRAGGAPTNSWQVAFRVAEEPTRRMILQHLLLGMNAHINLDLGIAVARIAPKEQLAAVYIDFLRINEMLFQMVDGLQGDLGSVSPRMWMVDRVGGTWDETFMRIGIRKARDLAWRLAERLASRDPGAWVGVIADRDRETVALASTLVRRWSPINLVGRVVARSEPRDVAESIAVFDDGEVDLDAVEAAVTVEAAHVIVADQPLAPADRFRRR